MYSVPQYPSLAKEAVLKTVSLEGATEVQILSGASGDRRMFVCPECWAENRANFLVTDKRQGHEGERKFYLKCNNCDHTWTEDA